jgi:hypothetical protein
MGFLMPISIFLLIFSLLSYPLMALEPLPLTNPHLLSACGLTGLSSDPANTLLNPATGSAGFGSSTAYLYGMETLNQYELSSVVESHGYGLFGGWQTLNTADYKRNDYRLGLRSSTKHLKLGAGVKLCYDEIPGYGSSSDHWWYGGLRWQYTQTTLDVSTEHLFAWDERNTSADREIDVCLGQSLLADGALAAGFTTYKDLPVNYKLGCRYQVTRDLQTTFSWESEPGRFGMGSSFSYGFLEIDYAVLTHPELPWSHALGMTFKFP